VLDEDDRLTLTGTDEARISADAVTNIALVLHELVTNAAKYGALVHAGGKLRVGWTLSAELVIEWTEHGGTESAVPVKTGFGSRLIQRTVEGLLKGTIDYHWEPQGLHVIIRLPLSAL